MMEIRRPVMWDQKERDEVCQEIVRCLHSQHALLFDQECMKQGRNAKVSIYIKDGMDSPPSSFYLIIQKRLKNAISLDFVSALGSLEHLDFE